MQHDIVELLDFVEYARQNFSNDTSDKLYFVREDLVDAFDNGYRQDRCSFYGCLIHVVSRGTRIEVIVIGLNDDVAFQREFIAKTIADHKAGTLAF